MTSRRILHHFKIDEISAVDSPAQRPARMTIMKRKEPDMPATFEYAIEEIQKRDSCSSMAAMAKARREYPGLYNEYQLKGDEMAAHARAQAMRSLQKSNAVTQFEQRVDEVQMRKGCSRLKALEYAARVYPQELEAYRSV